MKLIVGLGNPGREYENTRHNVGFQLLDLIATKKNLDFNKNKFNASYCECNINGEKVALVKPLSYMNLSGGVVAKFVSFYKIDFKDILVIQDDLDMRVGRVKIVHNSSSGGHNGIKDIERCLGTREYVRVKIGIANDKSIDTKDYVLGNFGKEEMENINNSVKTSLSIFEDFLTKDIEYLMQKYNKNN